jgi:exodeoxyribonuclease VII large subunit
VRDIIRVARKIFSGIAIVVRPVRVQGEGAREEIAQAVRDFNSAGGVDVIILARGGGSIEDLWAFNEEIVARSIRASRIPVVSAVGHEIDFTIADFAADVRAPTPSAAPGIVLADYADVSTRLVSLRRRARGAIASMIDRRRRFLATLATRYGLRRVRDSLLAYARMLDEATSLAQRLAEAAIKARRSRLEGLLGRVESLSPLATLARGYSVCFKTDTFLRVTSDRQIARGDRLRLVFAEGGAICAVERRDEERS